MNAALKRAGFSSLLEVQRTAARLTPKGSCGRRGLPDPAVATMYRDYLRLRSLSQVARLYGRTRQSMWSTFRDRGLPLIARNFQPGILWRGVRYTPHKGGYYRGPAPAREKLHYRIYQDTTGRAIPPGWQVTFRDGDQNNFKPSNLLCLPIGEVARFHYRRRYPDRAHLTREQLHEKWKAHYRARYHKRAAQFKVRGLRCDGKPMAKKKARRLTSGNAAWRALSDKPGSWKQIAA